LSEVHLIKINPTEGHRGRDEGLKGTPLHCHGDAVMSWQLKLAKRASGNISVNTVLSG